MAEAETATKTLQVTIVTPDGTAFDSQRVDMAVLATTDGEVGIMANRLPLVAALKIDQARFHIGDDTEVYAVNGGFAEFSDNLLTIVAPSAEDSRDIDVHRAEAARLRAEKRAQAAQTADDRKRAEVALARAINRINTSKLK
ncbi:MAG: F0F1 ATP synthase subunit epsilon [Lactobacillaceae bacterium]|jgi:F-type H+-transporting ATPase subunit epsilon|nr:F0F1 ATP synthase subunit epsilon [Lactobacillaceae bacterium]